VNEASQLMRNFRGRTAALKESRDPVHATSSQVAPTLVPFAIGGAGYFDSSNAMSVYLFLPSRMFALTEARVSINFREFFAPATTVASGGASTSGSGGSSTPTSDSGGASTPTSSSGGSQTVASQSDFSHVHYLARWSSDTPGGYATRKYSTQLPSFVDLATSSASDIGTEAEASPGHTHDVTISNHTHTVTIAAHTHTVTIAAHTHTTPDHTHALAYGVYKEAYPASHSVDLKLYQYSAGWNLIHTFSGLTADQPEVDMTDYLTSTGKWRIDLISQGGTPNSGRLGCDVSGFVLGAVQGA